MGSTFERTTCVPIDTAVEGRVWCFPPSVPGPPCERETDHRPIDRRLVPMQASRRAAEQQSITYSFVTLCRITDHKLPPLVRRNLSIIFSSCSEIRKSKSPRQQQRINKIKIKDLRNKNKTYSCTYTRIKIKNIFFLQTWYVRSNKEMQFEYSSSSSVASPRPAPTPSASTGPPMWPTWADPATDQSATPRPHSRPSSIEPATRAPKPSWRPPSRASMQRASLQSLSSSIQSDGAGFGSSSRWFRREFSGDPLPRAFSGG